MPHGNNRTHMITNNQDSFNKHESTWQSFHKSCLGRIVIAAIVLLVLLIAASLSRPTEEKMTYETKDNILQLIADNDSSKQDQIDNTFANVGYMFTMRDTLKKDTMWNTFDLYNTLEYKRHAFYSEMILHNTLHVMGKNCAVGFFGLVIPTIEYEDLLLNAGIMRKDYNQKIINEVPVPDEFYFGNDPDLDIEYEEH